MIKRTKKNIDVLSFLTSPFSTPGPPTCTLWYPPEESCPTEYWNGEPAKKYLCNI